jgi:hypothetical protein
MRTALLASLAAGLLCSAVAGLAGPAHAAISGAEAIDGPSSGILELGGVAMARDGAGGVVYLKLDGGRPHVFAAQAAGGHWRSPERVDVGQEFGSSWPRIAAGDGGRLVVVWVQESGPGSDRVFSASLDPGAHRFQAPVPIDLDVDEATATFPSIAMNPGGTAYLAYRVPTSGGSVFPGRVDSDVRVQRYNGALWSQVGTADRNPDVPVAAPTAANSPKVGVDVSGNGLVAFQEPDDDFVDRVWARRVFGASFGIPLIVSPQQLGGRPLRAPADGFTLDETGFGEGAVAFRQQGAAGSALSGAHVFVNTIAEAFSDDAGRFGGPRIADGAPSASLPAVPGTPAVGVTPEGDLLVAYGLGRSAVAVTGVSGEPSRAEPIGDGLGSADPEPVVELGDAGSAVVAWRARTATVAVQERTLAGAFPIRAVSAPAAGPVADLVVAGSGLGDGIVAYRQGDEDTGLVAAATVDAPPLEFEVQSPIPFVRSRRVRITWDPAPNALSAVRYSLTVDGNELAGGLTGRAATVRAADVGDGRHEVRVIAVDESGQETQSLPATLRIDQARPRVLLRRLSRRSVGVRISDGRRSRVSGLSVSRTTIAFGDGTRARRTARARHAYRRPGRYRLVVRTRDRAGNRATVRRTVRVR